MLITWGGKGAVQFFPVLSYECSAGSMQTRISVYICAFMKHHFERDKVVISLNKLRNRFSQLTDLSLQKKKKTFIPALVTFE